MKVLKEREYLLGNLSMLAAPTDLRNLDYAIKLQLERYERVWLADLQFKTIHLQTIQIAPAFSLSNSK